MSPNNANGDIRERGGHEPLRVMSPKMLMILPRPLDSPTARSEGWARPDGSELIEVG